MNQINRVMWGRVERPLTVFVPWDCGHHCPFCTTKKEYEEKYPQSRLDYFFGRLKESLRRLLAYGFVNEIVLTGGEPLADIGRLNELIDLIRGECRYDGRLYINTSLNLPSEKEDASYRFLCEEARSGGRVNGISVSLPYADVSMMNARGYALLGRVVAECNDKMVFNWVRVNSVVRGNESAEQIRQFVRNVRKLEGEHRHGIWSINLRKDYTTCTQANLNDCFDPIMQTLMGMPDMPYKGHGGCLVCRNDVFWPNDSQVHRLVYHRGTESTALRYGDLVVINDLVIKQDGEMRYDWCDGATLPKCVMDAFAKKMHHDPLNSEQLDWKWKNPIFSPSLQAWGDAYELTCRDDQAPGAERCGV